MEIPQNNTDKMDSTNSHQPYCSPDTQVIWMECGPVCQFGSPTGDQFNDPTVYDGFLL